MVMNLKLYRQNTTSNLGLPACSLISSPFRHMFYFALRLTAPVLLGTGELCDVSWSGP